VEVAVSQLGDDTNARELMEFAIAQAQELLADQSEVSIDDVRQILTRCYRNAVRRAYRQQAKLSLWGTSENLDRVRDPIASSTSQVDARLDLEVILRDTPEDIRRALLLRYGARSSWEEIASETSNTKDGIRMRCKRELARIAEQFGIVRKSDIKPQDLDHRR
jgi:DNA-directed RNA polymerase specialized sigma24 family protein